MTTLSSYPGISHGSGTTCESIGAAACIPWQNATTPSSLLRHIACMISFLLTLESGHTSKPSFSKTLAQSIAALTAEFTILGARNIP